MLLHNGQSEFTLEELDRLNNTVMQQEQAWDNRFEFSAPKFLERYLRGEICLCFQLRGRLDIYREDFCAFLCHPSRVRRNSYQKSLQADQFPDEWYSQYKQLYKQQSEADVCRECCRC